MTTQEYRNCLNYLNTIKSSVLIEAEMRDEDKTRFDTKYIELTGLSVPASRDSCPYYVWDPNANPDNKWGIELRLYFVSNDDIPQTLNDLARNNSRHGYQEYDKRINNNDFIWQLFGDGFRLGQN